MISDLNFISIKIPLIPERLHQRTPSYPNKYAISMCVMYIIVFNIYLLLIIIEITNKYLHIKVQINYYLLIIYIQYSL